MKQLLIGNAAIARGMYEAGVRVVSSYPGTPSTEITEFAAKYDEIYNSFLLELAGEMGEGQQLSNSKTKFFN